MKKGKNNIVLIVFYFACFIIVSGCMSRYGADDQYSYDGTYYIPSAGWYARMVDITGEKYKTLYLSKDPLMIEQPRQVWFYHPFCINISIEPSSNALGKRQGKYIRYE